MNEILQTVFQALWVVLPAYVANSVPVLVGGGPSIDGGKRFSDGGRILGDGKTIRGFLIGLVAGFYVGYLQVNFLPLDLWIFPEEYQMIQAIWVVPLLLALGALLGDVVGSFIKRRWGLKSGESALGLDQLEFIVGALLLVSVVWTPPLEITVTLLVLTPLIHLGLNFIGYKLGFKSEPY